VILAWRIAKRAQARQAFSGEGARIAGGRWNLPGDPVVYVSSTLALAAMETFIHLGEEGLSIAFDYFRIEIPGSVTITRCDKPPRSWRAEPPGESSMRCGSAWLREGRSAVLDVPSAIVPVERNLLLNPRHPHSAQLVISRPKPFAFDPRMWKS
jgi:RES domain-containing protein